MICREIFFVSQTESHDETGLIQSFPRNSEQSCPTAVCPLDGIRRVSEVIGPGRKSPESRSKIVMLDQLVKGSDLRGITLKDDAPRLSQSGVSVSC